ncbi:MAG TPA: FHA domain-containing protein [Kofleriaceae bacterium]|nr:FHA domain-containing protein [Kofleriaceae bacterium]
MGIFRRLFSADYRAAVAAEAAGDYELAAERYALAGHREAAVRVHLARASRAHSRADEIAALRDALHWAEEGTAERRRATRALGQALLVKSRAEGVATERDRERVREAASLLLEAGEHRAAGEAFESLGDEGAAAGAYRQGGMLDLMEQSLMRDEERSDRERELRQSFADYELHLRGGARDAALDAIRRCVASADGTSEYRRLLDELESRLVTGGRVALHMRRGERVSLAALPRVAIGRDPQCDLVLRSAGVSRRHAEIEVEAARAPDGPALRFALRDAGSRNGTRIGGLPVAGSVPLTGSGSFALSDDCSIDFIAGPDLLTLRIERGLDRGAVALLGAEGRAIPLAAVGMDGILEFRRGRPILLHPPGGSLVLNGERLMAGDVQLLHRDEVALGACEIEVA